MLTELRSQMKLIMWILVFAFLGTIIFSWGMGGFKDQSQAGIVGEIDGEEIKFEDFQRAIQQKIELETRNAGGELDPDKAKRAREDVWDEYIERLLKDRDADRLKIVVHDHEIAYIIENYPPPEIQNAEMFQRDGQFDLAAYQNFLRTPQASQFLIGLENSVREYLKQQKLNFHVSQAVSVTDEEVQDEFIKDRAKAKFKFVQIAFDDFDIDSVEITEEMMKKYYRQFPGRFKQYPQRQFAYVSFKVEPSSEDTADVLADARDLMEDLRNGADFADLAKELSQDKGSAQNGGDLDWFGRGKMVPEFDEAAFNAKPGALVGPVKSKFGFHIIKVAEQRQGDEGEEIRASHILLKVEASPDTRDEVYNEAYNFGQEVQERDFSLVVEEMGFKVDTTREFSQAGYVAGLGRMRMAATFCFKNEVGAVSGVYPYPAGYLVFKIVGGTEEGTKPYEAVEKSIRTRLEKLVQKEKAWNAVADLKTKITSPYDFDSIVEAAEYKIHVTDDSLEVSGTLPDGLPADADFMTEVFRLNPGTVSNIIEGKKGYYLVYMIDKTELDKELYLAMHEDIFQKLVSKKQDGVNRNWVRELRIAAEIEDYRYQYFKDF